MGWTYSTYKKNYIKVRKERDDLRIECSNQALKIKKLEKEIEELKKEITENLYLLYVKVGGK